MFYLVAGARPNFVKLAPLVHALRAHGRLPFKIIHTGQHYDEAMSGNFFKLLDIPPPDVNLEIGSGTQGEQTARVLERFERVLLSERPSAVIVFGDVNGTVACALAAVKLLVPVVHVEAGLRSFDRTMPEEINRVVTDAISDLLLVSEPSGIANLRREGIADEKVALVGNIMIDSLKQVLPAALARGVREKLSLPPQGYSLLTMHRPSNVDTPEVLLNLMQVFAEIARELPVLFPVHPRMRKRLSELGWNTNHKNLMMIEPLDYLDSIALQRDAKLIFTDSGGIQEEASSLGIPCVTLRENTERPITVELGSSTLVGNKPERIRDAFRQVLAGQYKSARTIPLWDGHTAERIIPALERYAATL